MEFKDLEDAYDGLCGEIYMTLKKRLVFHCLLCDGKSKNAYQYLLHMQNHGADDQSLNDSSTLLLETPALENYDSGNNIADLETLIIKTEEMSPEDMTPEEMTEDILEPCRKSEIVKDTKSQPEKKRKARDKSQHTTLTDPVDVTIVKEEQVEPASPQASPAPITQIDAGKDIEKNPRSKEKRTRKPSRKLREQVIAKQPEELGLLVPMQQEDSDDPLDAITVESTEEKKTAQHVQCLYCPMAFNTRKEYFKHKATHETTKTCPTCQKVFKHTTEFIKHVNEHGAKEELHRCPIYRCFRGFETEERLQTHMRIHTEEDEKTESQRDYERPYKCHICGYRAKDVSNIVNHVRRHNEANKMFQCQQCPKKFFTRTELKIHTRQHTGERPFLCPECGETFLTFGKLSAHKRQKHAVRERKYKCSICAASFFEKNTVKRHMSIHQEERNYACTYCEAKFKTQKGLSSHLKIHRNELAYRCHLCEKRFNQRPSLSAHLRTHK